jgi:hypothetical protein
VGDSSDIDIEAGTAFIHVDAGEEVTVDDYDIYVCESIINGAVLDANTPAASLKLCYTIATEVSQSSVPFWVGMRTPPVMLETDFFHVPGGIDEAHRVQGDAGLWMLRPSASLGDRLGDYFAAAVPAYFDGAYCDQSFGDLPDYYWTAYQTAADIVGDRATWEANLDAHMAAFFAALKGGFGTGRAAIGNSAGAVFPGIDGITIESVHIVDEHTTLAAFAAQRSLWEASANKYGDTVLNIAWDYDLNIAGLVFRGTIG